MPPSDKQTIEQLAARVEFLEDKIVDSLEIVKETQARMCDDISKIKEAVYNPDAGLYARLRLLEEERKTQSKFLWLIISLAIGSVGAAIVAHLN